MVCAVNLVQPQPKLLHPEDPNRRLTERNSAWLENMESAGPGLGEASQIWVMGYLELQNGFSVLFFIFSAIVLWQNMVTKYLLSLLFRLYSSVALSVVVLTSQEFL